MSIIPVADCTCDVVFWLKPYSAGKLSIITLLSFAKNWALVKKSACLLGSPMEEETSSMVHHATKKVIRNKKQKYSLGHS